jgi:CheY-like chemotaxis protein
VSKALPIFFINSTVLAQKVLQSDELKPMRILIADDQAGVGSTLALLVSAAKHHVVKVVSSGAEAIRAYRTYKPDVVLMDYSMGRLNGGTACRYILTEDPAARIVFVSGRPATDFADIGAVAFLPKPVELKDLEELLNNMDTQLVFDYARAR